MIVSLSGIASIRLFTPVFIYMLLIRYGGDVSFLANGVAKLQEMTPAWMNNDILFIIVGLLAVAEVVANWNSTVRDFLNSTDFEKYAKVIFSVLISFGFLSTQDAQGLKEIQSLPDLQPAASLPLAAIGAIFCGALTSFFVKLRTEICRFVHVLDPDNDFHLQTMLAAAEESMAVFLLALAIILPFLAFLLTLAAIASGIAIQTAIRKLEERTNHLCPACGESISSLAEKCPKCGAEQSEVAAVGLLGMPRKTFIDLTDADALRRHRHEMLMLHRCPSCATSLSHCTCKNCHADIWGDGTARQDIVRRLDRRAVIIAIVGLLVNGVPIIGFPLFLISFSVFALSPLRAFLNPFSGCAGKLLFTFLKVLFMLIIALVSAVIPFAGLLVYLPYGLYYLHIRKSFIKQTA